MFSAWLLAMEAVPLTENGELRNGLPFSLQVRHCQGALFSTIFWTTLKSPLTQNDLTLGTLPTQCPFP